MKILKSKTIFFLSIKKNILEKKETRRGPTFAVFPPISTLPGWPTNRCNCRGNHWAPERSWPSGSELNRQCQDYDFCPYKDDLSPPPEDVLGEVIPQDEQRCTRHLIRNRPFGQQLLHKLILRAETRGSSG